MQVAVIRLPSLLERLAFFAASLALMPIHAGAQSPQRPFASFDVASIRESRADASAHVSFPLTSDDVYAATGGSMHMSALPLSSYIAFAWKMDMTQSSAVNRQLPDWARSTRYDIEARADGDPTKDDMRRMMRALLEQRFQLKLHTEAHDAKVFDLELVHPGETGPKLKPHAADDPNCAGARPEGYFSPCHTVGFAMRNPKIETQRVAGRNVPLSSFILNCGAIAGLPVIDKTGLTGTWDLTLEFIPPTSVNADPNVPEPAGIPFEQAIRDQLGLKLVSDTAAITTFIVDHIERPSEN